MPPFLLQLIVGVALQVLGYIIKGGAKKPKPEAVTDMDTPTASAGTPMPVCFGENDLQVNVLFFTDKQTVAKTISQ